MKIVISDANILIDLVKLELLKVLLQLNFEIYMNAELATTKMTELKKLNNRLPKQEIDKRIDHWNKKRDK